MIVVRDRECGYVIDAVNSIEEGERLIQLYESWDKSENNYTPNFYEVYDDGEE